MIPTSPIVAYLIILYVFFAFFFHMHTWHWRYESEKARKRLMHFVSVIFWPISMIVAFVMFIIDFIPKLIRDE